MIFDLDLCNGTMSDIHEWLDCIKCTGIDISVEDFITHAVFHYLYELSSGKLSIADVRALIRKCNDL